MDQSPVTVAESKDIDTPAFYDPEKLTIFINPEYSHTAVFAALGGEIALARAHDRGYNLGFKRETFALDAQSVSYMVCRRFGVECPAPDMSEYVAEIFENYPASNRGEVLEGIRDAARKAGDSIEQTINPRQQERGGQRHFKAH